MICLEQSIKEQNDIKSKQSYVFKCTKTLLVLRPRLVPQVIIQ